jgi:hypothetical protein
MLQGFHCMLVGGEERCLAKSKGRPHVPVSARTLSLLRRYYRDHNFKYVFSHWSKSSSADFLSIQSRKEAPQMSKKREKINEIQDWLSLELMSYVIAKKYLS